MNTILLATDGSPSAKAATAAAVEFAGQTGWQLRVLTVWHTPIDPFGYAAAYTPELREAEKEHAHEVARTAVAIATTAGVAATLEVREGDAADEICEAAKETDARLVVVGAHGWGPLRRLVFGSVSTAVLHHASCPVLVVRSVEHATDSTELAVAGAAGR